MGIQPVCTFGGLARISLYAFRIRRYMNQNPNGTNSTAFLSCTVYKYGGIYTRHISSSLPIPKPWIVLSSCSQSKATPSRFHISAPSLYPPTTQKKKSHENVPTTTPKKEQHENVPNTRTRKKTTPERTNNS